MTTEIISKTDNPTLVIIAQTGADGVAGKDGQDGQGFNDISYSKLSNPLCRVFKFNEPASLLVDELAHSRNAALNYIDIYGNAQVAPNDKLALETTGYKFGVDDVVTMAALGNIPNLLKAWSLSVKLLPSAIDFCLLDTNNLRVSVNPDGFVSVNGIVSAALYGTAKTLVITYDGVDTLIYLDGVLADTISVVYVNDVQGVIRLFARLDGTRNLLGNVLDFRFYEDGLNESEALYLGAI